MKIRNWMLFLVLSLLLVGGFVLWREIKTENQPSNAHPTAEAHVDVRILSPVVQQIVTEGPTMPYLKFNYVIKELSLQLSQNDIDALLRFITQQKPQNFSDGEWGSLTNDIQASLTVQTTPNAKVAEVLIETYRDSSRSQLMRDYALQHIGGFTMYLVNMQKLSNNQKPEFFDSLVSELIAAASDSSKPWCGTSLNLLDGLLRAAEYQNIELQAVTAKHLCELAEPVVKNENASLNARLPALQLLSRRQSRESISLAERIISDENSKLMLVQSACAVIGEAGDLSDLPMLQKIKETGGIHKSPAAAAAIETLKKRFQN